MWFPHSDCLAAQSRTRAMRRRALGGALLLLLATVAIQLPGERRPRAPAPLPLPTDRKCLHSHLKCRGVSWTGWTPMAHGAGGGQGGPCLPTSKALQRKLPSGPVAGCACAPDATMSAATGPCTHAAGKQSTPALDDATPPLTRRRGSRPPVHHVAGPRLADQLWNPLLVQQELGGGLQNRQSENKIQSVLPGDIDPSEVRQHIIGRATKLLRGGLWA